MSMGGSGAVRGTDVIATVLPGDRGLGEKSSKIGKIASRGGQIAETMGDGFSPTTSNSYKRRDPRTTQPARPRRVRLDFAGEGPHNGPFLARSEAGVDARHEDEDQASQEFEVAEEGRQL